MGENLMSRTNCLLVMFLLSSTAIAFTGCASASDSDSATGQAVEALEGPYKVAKVTDGDTIHVVRNGKDIKVRIIGIDTPETVSNSQPIECYGPEASAFASGLLGGKTVYLEYDGSQDEVDKFGRTLAHVWTSDKKLYAAEAILEGFGVEMTYADPYNHRDLFLANQEHAKQEKVGLWGSCK